MMTQRDTQHEKSEPIAGELPHSGSGTLFATEMSPSPLVSVSSDLPREHARAGASTYPMAVASDRNWAIWVCLVLATVAVSLIVVLS
jgi:hypothetical protein